MKFALLFIGLMLLKGIELHRHKHGHESDTRQDDSVKKIQMGQCERMPIISTLATNQTKNHLQAKCSYI